MVSRMIDRYVDDVVERLPVRKRRQAATFLRRRIYESLRRYTGGEEPTNQDVRTVLRELGTPKEVARDYYEQIGSSFRLRKPDRQTVLRYVVNILLVLSVALVIGGLIGLTLGLLETGFPVFLGGAISVGILAAANIVPMPEEDAEAVREQERKR